jgi:hypothetical protein
MGGLPLPDGSMGQSEMHPMEREFDDPHPPAPSPKLGEGEQP